MRAHVRVRVIVCECVCVCVQVGWGQCLNPVQLGTLVASQASQAHAEANGFSEHH